jgi:two-component system cell cycle sensor histidine kinase/response regulator CckA
VALVVDDEPALRRLARKSLEGFGFEVVEACDSVKALEAVRNRKDDLRLILLDLTMPRMGGARRSAASTR